MSLEESYDSLKLSSSLTQSQTNLKPILFNTDMVRAILDGRKTVTRRVVKSLSEWAHYPMGISEEDGKFEFMCGGGSNGVIADWIEAVNMPYKFGDVLYVRETWQKAGICDDSDNVILETMQYYYAADGDPCFDYWVDPSTGEHKERMPWKPAIHMPKKAARIFLRVTNVRVEQLQDITIADCKREGVVLPPLRGDEYDYELDPDLDYLFGLQNLWDSTIKPKDIDKYGWNANPWVWVIEFERIERP